MNDFEIYLIVLIVIVLPACQIIAEWQINQNKKEK